MAATEKEQCYTYLAPAYIAILAVCASTGWICAGALYVWHRKTSRDKHNAATFGQNALSQQMGTPLPPSYSDMAQTPHMASPWKSRIQPPTPRRAPGSGFSQMTAARSAFSAPPNMQQARPPHLRAGSYY